MGTTAYGGKGSKAANGDRPVGAASCRQGQHTKATCQPSRPPPPPRPPSLGGLCRPRGQGPRSQKPFWRGFGGERGGGSGLNAPLPPMSSSHAPHALDIMSRGGHSTPYSLPLVDSTDMPAFAERTRGP